MKYLQDHFRCYRKFKGGRWACWNGFWEQECFIDNTGRHEFGFFGFKRQTHLTKVGKPIWYGFYLIVKWDDERITSREDYTKV